MGKCIHNFMLIEDWNDENPTHGYVTYTLYINYTL